MAALQHLDGDRWRVRVSFGRGKIVSRTFRAKGPQEAKQKSAEVEAEIRGEQRHHDRDQPTVTGLVRDWLATCERRGLSPSTLKSYRLHADRLVAKFGDLDADEVTGWMIDDWYSERIAAGASTADVAHLHAVVRAVFRWGYKNRGLTRIATDRATPPTHTAPEVSPPTSEQMRELLADVQGEWGRAVRLSTFSGMRRGEVVGLQWDDIGDDGVTVRRALLEVKGGGVHVKEPKGRRARRVTVGPAARVVLAEQRAESDRRAEAVGVTSPWVFPAWKSDPTGNTPHRPGWLSLAWTRHRDRHNMPTVRLHDVRHWYATNALASGVPVHAVAAQLGHAQASTTINIYGHATDAGRSAAATAAEHAIDG